MAKMYSKKKESACGRCARSNLVPLERQEADAQKNHERVEDGLLALAIHWDLSFDDEHSVDDVDDPIGALHVRAEDARTYHVPLGEIFCIDNTNGMNHLSSADLYSVFTSGWAVGELNAGRNSLKGRSTGHQKFLHSQSSTQGEMAVKKLISLQHCNKRLLGFIWISSEGDLMAAKLHRSALPHSALITTTDQTNDGVTMSSNYFHVQISPCSSNPDWSFFSYDRHQLFLPDKGSLSLIWAPTLDHSSHLTCIPCFLPSSFSFFLTFFLPSNINNINQWSVRRVAWAFQSPIDPMRNLSLIVAMLCHL